MADQVWPGYGTLPLGETCPGGCGYVERKAWTLVHGKLMGWFRDCVGYRAAVDEARAMREDLRA